MSKNTLADQPTLFGHPIGLFVLFFTEMWERFSYYGMRAILVLYMVQSATANNPGLGWSNTEAFALYGWYTMMVYVMSIPGGILADKYIGQKKSVLLGGIVLIAGHSILAVEQDWAFYTGLILIILGVGALKPNISTMVGGLYRQGDQMRDQGFTIFYIGINTGAFLASLIVGVVGQTIGWHYGFGLAGIGMAVGVITFYYGQKYLVGIGEAPNKGLSATNESENTSLGTLIGNLFKSPVQLVVTIVLIIVSAFGAYNLNDPGFDRWAFIALGIFLSIVVGLLMMVYRDINKIEKDRFIVLLISFLIVIVFWGAFEQAGGLMNVYTNVKIDREVSLWVLDAMFILSGGFLLWKGIQDTRKKRDTNKLFLALSAIVFIVYAILRTGALTVSPYEIPASVFQSVNALFIMIFGTMVGGFWIWRSKVGKENSSLYKMAIGTIIMGIGFLFMAKASHDIDVYGDKAALILLILAYLLHTIGELCASPVALSFITKVAPVKYVSLMMGLYFAASGLGNKVAGTIGEASQVEPVAIEIAANASLNGFVADSTLFKAEDFEIVGKAKVEGGQVVATTENADLFSLIKIKESEEGSGEAYDNLKSYLQTLDDVDEYTLICRFGYDARQKVEVNEGRAKYDIKYYEGEIEVFEYQDDKELKTFIGIFLFTAAFGILLLIFLKRLKKLTHGAEELEVGKDADETEGFELGE
jgi:POT family proton-dependent oligopeptide transporter